VGVWIGIVEGVGVAAVGVDGDRAVGSGDGGADVGGQAVDLGDGLGGAIVDVGVVGQHVAGCGGIAGEGGVAGVDAGLGDDIGAVHIGDGDRCVVGAGDGDGEGGGGRGAEIVDHGVGELVGDDLALGQGVGVWIGIVEGVGVAAVGVDGDRAVGSGDGGADVGGQAVDLGDGLGGAIVDVGVVGQHVAGCGGIAGEGGVAGVDAGLGGDIGAVHIGDGDRCVVGSGDGDGEGGGGRGAEIVDHGVGELVGDDLALCEGVGVWIGIVEGVGVAAVGVDGDRAVGSGDGGADVG